MMQIKLAIIAFAILTFGCNNQGTVASEAESIEMPVYHAYALLDFRGGQGSETLFPNQVQHFATEKFQVMVNSRFSSLWSEQENPAAEDMVPAPGKYSFEQTKGLVTLTAEASDPKIAIITANAVAQSAEELYRVLTREATDESVAWLEEQVEQQVEKLRGIDQEIRKLRDKKDEDYQIQTLLEKRETQVEVVNGIREIIEKERLRHDRKAVSVYILERAEKAFEK
jgi:hypothetical protein